MAVDRKSLRGAILVEDKRQERFVRALLRHLGFDIRKFRFYPAPSGQGSAEAWVRERYPDEVAVLRTKRYQKCLCLLAMRDGDASGVMARKRELDRALESRGHASRQDDERIATPVPTWSIETWILCLLGDTAIGEDASHKAAFPPKPYGEERQAIEAAARCWPASGGAGVSLPSLVDGCDEVARLSR